MAHYRAHGVIQQMGQPRRGLPPPRLERPQTLGSQVIEMLKGLGLNLFDITGPIPVSFLFLLLFANAVCARAQPRFVHLDTIISTMVSADSCYEGNFSCTANDKEALIYLPSVESSDVLSFLRVDQSLSVGRITVRVPGLDTLISEPTAHVFAADTQHVVLGFEKRILILRRKGATTFTNPTWIEENASFNRLLLMGDSLVIVRCYPFNPMETTHPSMLKIYSLRTGQYSKEVYPAFDGLELCRFEPFSNTDARAGKILFAQTLRYQIDIFNENLEVDTAILLHPVDWVNFDSSFLLKVAPPTAQLNPRDRIMLLEEEEARASRVELVRFIDDSTFFVQWIPARGNHFPRIREFDVWRYDSGRCRLLKAGLLDSRPTANTVYTSDNYPLESAYASPLIVMGGRLVVPRFAAAVNPIGLSVAEYQGSADEWIQTRAPELQLFLYEPNY